MRMLRIKQYLVNLQFVKEKRNYLNGKPHTNFTNAHVTCQETFELNQIYYKTKKTIQFFYFLN
jgi:hypothetical protein